MQILDSLLENWVLVYWRELIAVQFDLHCWVRVLGGLRCSLHLAGKKGQEIELALGWF
jgi:hypothetical protein